MPLPGNHSKTPAKALKELLALPRLQFGNDEHLVRILQHAEDLIGTVRECPDCDGDGEHAGECDNCGARCRECSDAQCKTCKGAGELSSTRDSVYGMTHDKICAALEIKEVA